MDRHILTMCKPVQRGEMLHGDAASHCIPIKLLFIHEMSQKAKRRKEGRKEEQKNKYATTLTWAWSSGLHEDGSGKEGGSSVTGQLADALEMLHHGRADVAASGWVCG